MFETLQRTDDLNLGVERLQEAKKTEYCSALKGVLDTKTSVQTDWVKHHLTEGKQHFCALDFDFAYDGGHLWLSFGSSLQVCGQQRLFWGLKVAQ